MRKHIRRALCGLVVLGILTEAALVGAVMYWETHDWPAHEADVMIVPGAQVKRSGEPGDTLSRRLEAAMEAWEQGLAKYVIVCGGQGRTEPRAEAEVMAEYLIERGVPEECVLAEAESVNTRENMAGARSIMEAQGWESAVVVTSGYHMLRALDTAEDAGIEACGYAAEPAEGIGVRWLARIRETLSWMKFYLLERGLGYGT